MKLMKPAKGFVLTALTSMLIACGSADDKAIKSSVVEAPQNLAGAFDTSEHLYLEEVYSEKALSEVKTWNERTKDRLTTDPKFKKFEAELYNIASSKEKIPRVSIENGEVHNIWQDENNKKGLWRKSSLSSYLNGSPQWETILDIDKLAKDDGKNWVLNGRSCLAPVYEQCILSLSDGGKDAVYRREFNTKTKRFVEGGFSTGESKGSMSWVDKDTVTIGIDFGEDSLTSSGYPMISKLWERGTPISSATEIDRATKSDVVFSIGAQLFSNGEKELFSTRHISSIEVEKYWYPRGGNGELLDKVKIPIPPKSSMSFDFKGQMLLKLGEDWRGFSSGSLVSFSFEDFSEDGVIDQIYPVFIPDEKSSLSQFRSSKSKLFVIRLHDVKASAYVYDWDGEKWTHETLPFKQDGNIYISASSRNEESVLFSVVGFLQPDTLYSYDTKAKVKKALKSLPNFFDSTNMVSEQFFVASKDGTKIPYFVVRDKDIKYDGSNPTLLYGYGGFQSAQRPRYLGSTGKVWLENGGVFVLSNIRGGSEYGPQWHQAGLKTNRQRIYDDFIAIAEDLIDKKITSPKHLGIRGGSNGGLLVGVMLTQRPDLFNAVICSVPLLDMMRYHKLLAGASWMGEYGNPEDKVEGAFLRKISPYHNVTENAEYPEVFFTTSTKDDRVHPGHARKMAKRMEDLGHDFLYFESLEGGHGGSVGYENWSKLRAMQYVYLFEKLGKK